MKYYKITNKDEKHNGMQYKTGLNVDILPFNPKGNCEPGGIYFSREDILAFLDYGCWIREVKLPKDAQVYENPDKPKKWKANKVILGCKYKITAKKIQQLIDEGANANDSDAIKWAAVNGHLEIVKVLIKNGCNANNYAALRYATKNGHLEIVKVLIKNGANANDFYAIYHAAKNGHLEIVKVLIKNGFISTPRQKAQMLLNGQL